MNEKKKIDPAQEIGSELTITERNQFFSIINEHYEQAQQIKSLRIENQSIDDEIYYYFKNFNEDIEQLYFVNCSFNKYYVLSTFHGKKAGFIRCNLSYDILDELLCSASPYNNYDVLDLTGNELGKDPDLFVKIMCEFVMECAPSVKELILVDNGFDENIISLLKEKVGHSIKKVYI